MSKSFCPAFFKKTAGFGTESQLQVRIYKSIFYRRLIMSLLELFILAIGLSMDAFAVSICKGLATKKVSIKNSLTAGLWFGGFQALMPVIGFILGMSFRDYIMAVDHWIAFILLGIIGANMIKESMGEDEEDANDAFDIKTMFLMAVATSIDALAIGITFAFLNVNIISAVSLIGITTFILSAAGVFMGCVFGSKYKSKAEFAGGVILVLLGLKILLEHLAII